MLLEGRKAWVASTGGLQLQLQIVILISHAARVCRCGKFVCASRRKSSPAVIERFSAHQMTAFAARSSQQRGGDVLRDRCHVVKALRMSVFTAMHNLESEVHAHLSVESKSRNMRTAYARLWAYRESHSFPRRRQTFPIK